MHEQTPNWRSRSLLELRACWTKAFGSAPPPGLGRTLLARGVAWKEQEQRHGGFSATVERQLRALGRELERSGELRLDRRRALKPGTRLIREWGGQTHVVESLENGFHYRDQHYSSLSTVAQAITGVKWSGPRFFGLKRSAPTTEAAADA